MASTPLRLLIQNAWGGAPLWSLRAEKLAASIRARVDVTIGALTDQQGNSDSFWVLSTGVSGYFNLDLH